MSPEYPDLQFALPRAWGLGRDGKAVRYLVVHYTAGSENRTSAEDGAAYDRRRTDGTSTHYFVDPDSVFQEVLTTDRANAAFSKGNRLGIQYELCGTAQTRAQWLDPASDAILWNAARQMARDCQRYGIPVRKLTPAEVRAAWYQFPNGPKGICGHADVTLAYPEDGGTHTDPGAQFPWDVLLDRINAALGTPTPDEEDDMKSMLGQVAGDPTVWFGDGWRRRTVSHEAAVRALIAAGASKTNLTPYYGGSNPFDNEEALAAALGADETE